MREKRSYWRTFCSVTSSPPCCSGLNSWPSNSTTARLHARFKLLHSVAYNEVNCKEVCYTNFFPLFQWFLDRMADDNWWPMQILIKCPNQIVRQVRNKPSNFIVHKTNTDQTPWRRDREAVIYWNWKGFMVIRCLQLFWNFIFSYWPD